MNYLTIIHNRIDITTIEGLVNESDSLFTNLNISELLAFRDDDEISNLTHMYNAYSEQDKLKYKDAYQLGSLSQLVVDTTLNIPIDRLNREVLNIESENFVESRNSIAFVAQQLIALQNDTSYIPTVQSAQISQGSTQLIHPSHTVWIWCRVLNQIIDISAFITQLSTTTNAESGAGTFQLNLSGITVEYDTEGNVLLNSLNTHATSASSSVNVTRDGMLKQSSFAFHNIIQENDIVWIRYEKMDNELKRDVAPNYHINTVDRSQLPNQIYDMIGLVDQDSLDVAPASNDISISISGRDPMKLLIEDGAYFYPEALVQQLSQVDQDSNLLKRVVINGTFEVLFKYLARSIDTSVKFVINQLSNIGIAPDDLFTSYIDKTTFYDLEGSSTINIPVKGIWQIIKLVVDNSIASRRVVDQSICTAEGSLINYINKICQSPWVSFYGDTYGDQYYFTIRQNPFAYEGFTSLIPNESGIENAIGVITAKDVVQQSLRYETDNIFSWYRVNSASNTNGFQTETRALTPAVYLDEYAAIWGSKAKEETCNYTPHIPLRGDKEIASNNYYQRQTIHDLRYLIESHMYMPFTRTGTIMINGDRRIKKGTIIRYQVTGEIFYVEAVTHSLSISSSIDYTTTLQVSRGMVEKYVKRGTDLPSYFDLVDMNIETLFEQSRPDQPDQINLRIATNWKVNPKVFDFFVKRKQWAK